MVPLANEPSIRLFGVHRKSVFTAVRPWAGAIARSDSDGFPSAVVIIEWQPINTEWVCVHVELQAGAIEEGWRCSIAGKHRVGLAGSRMIWFQGPSVVLLEIRACCLQGDEEFLRVVLGARSPRVLSGFQ